MSEEDKITGIIIQIPSSNGVSHMNIKSGHTQVPTLTLNIFHSENPMVIYQIRLEADDGSPPAEIRSTMFASSQENW